MDCDGVVGVFNRPVRLGSMDGQRSLEIEAMVDGAASYTIAPANLLKDLRVQPMDKVSLVLGDGSRWTWEKLASLSTGVAFLPWWYSERTAPAVLGPKRWKGCAWRLTRSMAWLVPTSTAWA